MIDHLSNRLDNIIQQRNDIVHRHWFIGWGNEDTESYDVASSMKGVRNIGKKGGGGIKYTNKDTKIFEEVIEEIQKLTSLVNRFGGCLLLSKLKLKAGGGGGGKPEKNFHYENGVLLEGGSA